MAGEGSGGVGSPENNRVQQPIDDALRALSGEDGGLESATRRFTGRLRRATREAPLHSLVIAFLLGVLIARRR